MLFTVAAAHMLIKTNSSLSLAHSLLSTYRHTLDSITALGEITAALVIASLTLCLLVSSDVDVSDSLRSLLLFVHLSIRTSRIDRDFASFSTRLTAFLLDSRGEESLARRGRRRRRRRRRGSAKTKICLTLLSEKEKKGNRRYKNKNISACDRFVNEGMYFAGDDTFFYLSH